MEIINIKVDDLVPYENNPRNNNNAVDNVANSIKEFGFKVPIVIDSENVIITGHTRLKAAQKLGITEVPCIVADDLNEEQIKAFRLADNKLSELATWDIERLNLELDEILNLDMSNFGFDDVTNNISEDYTEKTPETLRKKFIVPPFSVLDARNGEWQKRKKSWLKIISSGKGRSDTLLGKGLYDLALKGKGNTSLTGTSIFDPVLCEIIINWFSAKGGKILDPFAGGSVRGIVSSYLQREYYGNDLSEEQIEANIDEYSNLKNERDFFGQKLKEPIWSCGDSLAVI